MSVWVKSPQEAFGKAVSARHLTFEMLNKFCRFSERLRAHFSITGRSDNRQNMANPLMDAGVGVGCHAVMMQGGGVARRRESERAREV